MFIKAFPSLFLGRKLPVLIAALLFVTFYFPSSNVQERGSENDLLAEVLPIPETATTTAGESLTQDRSTTIAVPHVTEALVSTVTTPPTEADHSIQESNSTDSSTSQEVPISTPIIVDFETSSTTTTLPHESNPLASTPPEVVQGSQFYIDPDKHRTVSSISTTNRAFFEISWLDNPCYNPSILPHPNEPSKYILVAQLRQNWVEWLAGSRVMECIASFENGVLACSDPPKPLPIAWTPDTFCKGDPYPGPHDPRILYGPKGAYMLYGSRSAYTCHGMWIQDLPHLLSEFNTTTEVGLFPEPTEVQRPPPYREIEKNYFIFWDYENNTYVHHDLSPDRIFTALHENGSVGPDLAPLAKSTDGPCLAKHMPKFGVRNGTGVGVEYETIHQTTNSLAITLCMRSDPDCHPTSENTFIMVIFQHKSFYAQHAEYFPYVMLFQQNAPFAIHALSSKSIWIRGRGALTKETPSLLWRGRDDLPNGHSEMFFVVSISWKRQGQMYHGFMDDELFVGFGIEDATSAGIDILAGDLLQDLAYCSDEDHQDILNRD